MFTLREFDAFEVWITITAPILPCFETLSHFLTTYSCQLPLPTGPRLATLWDYLYSSCRYQRSALARPRGHRLTLDLVTKDLVNGIWDRQGLEKCDTDIWSQSFCCLVTRRTSQFKGPDVYLPKAKQKPRNVGNSRDSLLLVTSGLRRVDQRWGVELKPELRKHSLRSVYNSQGPPPRSAHSVLLILLSLS